MAKQTTIAAERTPDLFGAPRRVGRPRSAHAMTNAERQRKFIQRHKYVEVGERMKATISRLAREFDLTEDEVIRELIRFSLCNKNWFQTGFPGVRGRGVE